MAEKPVGVTEMPHAQPLGFGLLEALLGAWEGMIEWSDSLLPLACHSVLTQFPIA